jgi:hypothetical protein
MRNYTAEFNFNGITQGKNTTIRKQTNIKKTSMSNPKYQETPINIGSSKYIKAFAINASRKVISTIIGTIGIRTGNYAKQRRRERQLNNVSKVGVSVLSFVANPILGLVTTGGMVINEISRTYTNTLSTERDNEVSRYNRYLQGFTFTNGRD